MNLRNATTAFPGGILTAFSFALDQARNIQKAVFGPDAEQDPLRTAIRTALTDAIERIGEDDFVTPDPRAMLGDAFNAAADWPLCVIADALSYCDASAKSGDGGVQSGMGSIADGLERLKAVTTKFTVKNGGKTAWTDAFAAEVEVTTSPLKLSGAWVSEMTSDGTLSIAPVSLPWAVTAVEHAITFKVIDQTLVPSFEADIFRLTRAKLLGEKIKAVLDEVTALQARQQAILMD